MPKGTDTLTPRERSLMMSRIRGRGNLSTEVLMARLLRAAGIKGWRRHRPIRVPGANGRIRTIRPDFTFPKARLLLFIDGCFWHGCPLHRTHPTNNAAFWRAKIDANRARDRRTRAALCRMGWKPIAVWEHTLRSRHTRRLLVRIGDLVRHRG